MANGNSGAGATRLDPAIYQAHFDMWIHQDELQWSRVNWMIAVEGAAIAAVGAKPGLLGLAALLIGTTLLLMLLAMFLKDVSDQDPSLRIMDRFHTENGLHGHQVLADTSLPARKLFYGVLGLMIFVNILLFVITLSPLAEWTRLRPRGDCTAQRE